MFVAMDRVEKFLFVDAMLLYQANELINLSHHSALSTKGAVTRIPLVQRERALTKYLEAAVDLQLECTVHSSKAFNPRRLFSAGKRTGLSSR
jgi:hypothetical protein